MKEVWQKAMIFLLAVAILAAFTVGQRGETKGNDSGSSGTSDGMEEAKEGNLADPAKRIAREGKLLEGWTEAPCIVIDPGHGGFDPGKMGINQMPEKDVNLAIAKMLRDDLEACGVRVVMTREEDCALCDEGAENAKVQDMKRRIEIIEEAKPIAAVSIHQNSYPESYVKGAQVFYYVDSKEGMELAESLQARLIAELDPENGRKIKDNNSYYLLKKTSVPIVIAECGFLSNWEEAEKLSEPEWQEEVAWALYLGIMDYLEKK